MSKILVLVRMRNGFHKRHPAVMLLYQRVAAARAKQEVFRAYGGEHPACACCGVADLRFLTIDHEDNNGAAHRRELKCVAGKTFYNRLRRDGFPKDRGLIILCYNCNIGRQANGGVCPHKALPVDHEAALLAAKEASGIRTRPATKNLGRPFLTK